MSCGCGNVIGCGGGRPGPSLDCGPSSLSLSGDPNGAALAVVLLVQPWWWFSWSSLGGGPLGAALVVVLLV